MGWEAAGMLTKYGSLLPFLLILMFCIPSMVPSIVNMGQRQPVRSRDLAGIGPRASWTAAQDLGSSLVRQSDVYNRTLKMRIAAVEPVFTTTAYSSFYSFYSKFGHRTVNPPTRSDLALLNASLVTGWGWSDALRRFLTSKTAGDQYDIVLGRNLSFISEVNVTQGALFRADGTRNYDVLILGFTEYVTAQEYYAYKTFVTTGGVLVLMDATNFLAEVQYYPRTQHLALIRGHGWRFNGTMASHDIFDRWRDENTNWIGGTFGVGSSSGAGYTGAVPVDENSVGRALKEKYGGRVFTRYGGHEEDVVTNLTRTSIIANWVQAQKTDFHPNVSAYLHYYRNGVVAHLGVMGSDVIMIDDSVQFFLAQTLLFAAGLNYPISNPPSTPATAVTAGPISNDAAYKASSLGDVVAMSRRDRMIMPFLLVGVLLLVSFLTAAVRLRRHEHTLVKC